MYNLNRGNNFPLSLDDQTLFANSMIFIVTSNDLRNDDNGKNSKQEWKLWAPVK